LITLSKGTLGSIVVLWALLLLHCWKVLDELQLLLAREGAFKPAAYESPHKCELIRR
jgi:hypothetical protein